MPYSFKVTNYGIGGLCEQHLDSQVRTYGTKMRGPGFGEMDFLDIALTLVRGHCHHLLKVVKVKGCKKFIDYHFCLNL